MVHIIPRSDWGARYQDGYDTASIPARYLILHHSVTIAPDLIPPFTDDDAAVRLLEQIGQERFSVGMSYTFAVTPSGRVYQGVSINRASPHTLNHNYDARAIVLVGNYQTVRPTKMMIRAVAELVLQGWLSGWWTPQAISGGHRDFETAGYTECPGNAGEATIPSINALVRTLAAGGNPVPEATPTLTEVKDAVKHGTAEILSDATHPGYLTKKILDAVEALQADVDIIKAKLP